MDSTLEKTLINELLGQNGFIILNKRIIKKIGIENAIIFSFLIDKWKFFDCNDFFYKIDDIKQDVDMGEHIIRKSLKFLKDKNILIDKGLQGLPAKQFYNFNTQAILSIFKDDSDDKKPIPSHSKFDRAKTCKNAIDKTSNFASAYNSNNTYSNNTYSNNTYSNGDFKKTADYDSAKEKEKLDLKEKQKESNQELKELENDFEKFWQLYPRKVSKAEAKKAYIKCRQGKLRDKHKPQSKEKLLNALNAFREILVKQNTDIQFIPHCATWLNQARFLDDYFNNDFNARQIAEYGTQAEQEAKRNASFNADISQNEKAEYENFLNNLDK